MWAQLYGGQYISDMVIEICVKKLVSSIDAELYAIYRLLYVIGENTQPVVVTVWKKIVLSLATYFILRCFLYL